MLVKQLCGAYKAEVKLDEKAAAAREEKKKDLEVVRSARYNCMFHIYNTCILGNQFHRDPLFVFEETANLG